MQGTFALPDGHRIHTTTRRRYLLVGHWSAEQAAASRWPEGPYAAGFTDNLATARRRAGSKWRILDTHTGEVMNARPG